MKERCRDGCRTSLLIAGVVLVLAILAMQLRLLSLCLRHSLSSATPAAAQGERAIVESSDNPQVEEVQTKLGGSSGTQQARLWRLEGARTRVKDVGRSVTLPTSRQEIPGSGLLPPSFPIRMRLHF